MPVHQFGLAADMNAIVKVAQDCELKIIEDAACALGAEYQGQKCGTMGTISCFSFHPRKVATTGEGGVAVTDDDVIAEKVRSLRNHGSLNNDFVLAGYNYRMSDINAALGVAQLRKLPMLIERRREVARLYEQCLLGVAGLSLPQDLEGARHTYQSYVVCLDAQLGRDKAILGLKERGVEAGIGTYAIHQLRCYSGKWDPAPNRLSRSATAYRRTLSLPLYAQMTEDDVRYVCEALKEYLGASL
jgi:dTDP-4-amino-4,6-dideoxygalactose transaminase